MTTMEEENQEEYSMVQECTNHYSSKEINEREVEIVIRVPKRFYTLWLVKLSDLTTNMKEIEEYEKE